jgi:hypothetical protein
MSTIISLAVEREFHDIQCSLMVSTLKFLNIRNILIQISDVFSHMQKVDLNKNLMNVKLETTLGQGTNRTEGG